MATIPITLYNRYNPGDPVGQGTGQNRFLAGPNGGVPGAPCTPANAGDTLAISLFFLNALNGDTSFQYHRYAGSQVEINLASFGIFHIYAQAFSTTEIVPTTGITVTRPVTGTQTVIEKQRLVFNSTPHGGTFRFVIQLPASCVNNAIDAPAFRAALYADVTVPWDITAAQLESLLRSLAGYHAYNQTCVELNGATTPQRFIDAGLEEMLPIVTAITGGFEIQFGSLYAGRNSWLTGIPLIIAEDFNILYAYGYSISLPLTASDFTDLFKANHAPAFLDCILRPPGGGTPLTGQIPLPISDSGVAPAADFSSDIFGGDPPVTVNFSDLSTNSPTSWAWNFGDGGTSTSRNPSHTYTVPGTYNVSLTATNGTGSGTVTKNGYISITSPAPPPPSGYGDCSGGYGTNPALPCTYFDGDYSVLSEVDFPRRELVEEHPGLEIWHQTYEQRSGSFVRVPIGAAAGIGGYLARDTIWSPQGSDIIRFERISHNKPPDRSFPVSVTKNYQAQHRTTLNGVVVDIQIITWSAVINAVCSVHYALGFPGLMPKLPFIQIVSVTGAGGSAGFKFSTDFGTGFPRSDDGWFADNVASSFISGSIERVIGNLYCLKIIRG